MKYIQDNLPNFDREYAIAQQKTIEREATLRRLATFYVRMDKCRDKDKWALCQRQKKILQQYFMRDRE
jgi:hypothetical protein